MFFCIFWCKWAELSVVGARRTGVSVVAKQLVLHSANLRAREVALLANTMAVEVVVALEDVCAKLFSHHWLAVYVATAVVTVTLVAGVAYYRCANNKVWLVVVNVCSCIAKGGHCAEDHHSDYHHALHCCLHIRFCFYEWFIFWVLLRTKEIGFVVFVRNFFGRERCPSSFFWVQSYTKIRSLQKVFLYSERSFP